MDESILYSEDLFDESWTRVWEVNRLFAMAKNAETIVVYWEVCEQRKQLLCRHFQSAWESLPLYLQVHDVTDTFFDGYNSHSVRRFPVQTQHDNWYIRGLQSGRRYVVDFATKTEAGEFFTILRSNLVSLPPALQSHKILPSITFSAPYFLAKVNPPQAPALPTLEAWPPYGFDGYGDGTNEPRTTRRAGQIDES
jgi:hypothetical protein